MERYFVDVKTDRIVRDDLCTVRLEKGNGEILAHLEPKRLFPFTRPDEYISLKVDDREEAAMVRRLSDLSEESQTALQECFAEIYMIPKITKVLDASAKSGSANWTVETDHGKVSFRVRNINNDIKMISGDRMLIRDSNDNRYEIPNMSLLDATSKKKLFTYT